MINDKYFILFITNFGEIENFIFVYTMYNEFLKCIKFERFTRMKNLEPILASIKIVDIHKLKLMQKR